MQTRSRNRYASKETEMSSSPRTLARLVRSPTAVCFILLLATVGTNPVIAAPPNGPGTYEDLLQLFQDFQAWKTPAAKNGRVDFGPVAIAQRRAEIRSMQRRMDNMGV